MLTTQKLLLPAILLLTANLPAQQYHGKAKDINQILTNTESFSGYYVNGDYEKSTINNCNE